MHGSDEHAIEPDGGALYFAYEHPPNLSIGFGWLARADFHENRGRAVCLQESDFKVPLFERHDVTLAFDLFPRESEMPPASLTTQHRIRSHQDRSEKHFFCDTPPRALGIA